MAKPSGKIRGLSILVSKAAEKITFFRTLAFGNFSHFHIVAIEKLIDELLGGRKNRRSRWLSFRSGKGSRIFRSRNESGVYSFFPMVERN